MANPKMKFSLGTRRGRKKPGSRMLALHCKDCGYRIWATRSWLLKGIPSCPVDGTVLVLKNPELMQTLLVPKYQLDATLRGIIESAPATAEGEPNQQ